LNKLKVRYPNTNQTIVDMRSQSGLLLEDLMKIEWSSIELSWSHYH